MIKMTDYVYNPPDYIPSEEETQHTTIQDLDAIEIQQRQGTKTLNPDNNYPDELKKPLFVKTVEKVKEVQKPNPVKKIGDTSIKQFISKIIQSFIDILNDLLSYRLGEDDFIEIFTKDTYRLLSIAVILISVSVFLAFFRDIEN